MSANDRVDMLVVGGGPAGIQASRMVKSERPDWKVAMLRPEPASMVYCAIPYALEGLIPVASTLKKDELVTELGIELIRESAESVDLEEHRVVTDTGRVVSFERLFVATGARPLVPPLPGHDLERIVTIKTEDDMRRMMGFLDEGAQRVVVVGAGAIGIEQAIAYRRRGLDVHLVDLAERVLPHLADADTTEPARLILEDMGIRLHLGAGLARFEGQKAVSAVVLQDETRITLEEGKDAVVLSIGMRPNVELFENKLDVSRDGIIVDEGMRTSHPAVFAAGDVIQNRSLIDGKPLGGRLATNAVPQAKIAARTMLGEDSRYPGIVNGAATVIGDLRIGGTGFTESYAKTRGFEPLVAFGESTSRFPMMPDARPVRVKLIADAESGRLIGGQVRGYEAVAERIDVITLAIQQGLTPAELAELSYSAQPWQTFFPAKNAIVEAATRLAKECVSA